MLYLPGTQAHSVVTICAFADHRGEKGSSRRSQVGNYKL